MWSTLISLALAATPDVDDSMLQSTERPVAVRLYADVGFLGQISHTLQVGADGTDVRIPKDLGQDVLYPFLRFQTDLDLGRARRHTVAFLYQPLDLRSTVAPTEPLQVGDVTFPGGRGLEFRYGFSFWRTSWLYDLAPDTDREVALGLGLQIRNANIIYTALDGSRVVASRNIGPVPLLAGRTRHPLGDDGWIGTELQGFWAPIRLLNGSTSDVEGAIADASVKLGLSRPGGVDGWVAARYIGGGAVGTSSNADPFTDGYTKNWLHFFALSIGAGLR
jgi:hypothetical protein